jgi:CMP-N,N'-diacetyllegionaminic acid synthase
VNGTIVAIIPARAGSKGLPGKNLRLLGGMPLVGHAIELAKRSHSVSRVVVSTDSSEIADVSRAFGAEVPFLRPQELAQDDTDMWSVVRHALEEIDPDRGRYEAVLLLQPTSPIRLPEDAERAVELLYGRADADGVIGVSEPSENPIWSAMVEREGILEPLLPGAGRYVRRQDVPRVVNVNGLLYLWRAQHVRAHDRQPDDGRYLGLDVSSHRAIDIDTEADLEAAELLLREGIVRLPWL